MKLYVCWETRHSHPILGEHPCGIAHEALVTAGYQPEVLRGFGWNKLPGLFNQTPVRRKVRRLTGSIDVPVLVTDEGEVIADSQRIVAWAHAHPAGSQEPAR